MQSHLELLPISIMAGTPANPMKIFDPTVGLEEIWIIYDSRGILQTWLSHLDWLDSHLPIRNVQMAKAPKRLFEAMR